MKTIGLIKRFYELNQRIKSLEKVKATLYKVIKKEVPFGLTSYGKYVVYKQEVEEHEVPSYIMPGHIKLTVRRK